MNVIVAVDSEWGIGYKGDLLARVKEDLQNFARLTTGKTVILGSNTLATFPGGRVLKDRRNIVLNPDPEYAPEGAVVVHSLEELFACLRSLQSEGLRSEDIFVIGGASVYRQLLPYCEKAYVTVFCRRFEKDVWFPDLDELPEWRLVCESEPVFGKFRGAGGAEGEISFVFREYSREKAAPLFA
ncbi:MAG: dihydrofolate reductase [Clostridiales bacterium]|nr:dihydrofolate reductase [Clostridiales bacterium]